MIRPLATICELINDKQIESQLRSISQEEQVEVFEAIKFLLTDEIHFVLSLRQSINEHQKVREVH